MQSGWIEKGVPAGVALVGAAFLSLWITGYYRASGFRERSLGMDPVRTTAVSAAGTGSAPSFYHPEVTVDPLPGLWPGYRGPNRDGVNSEATRLARSWPPSGPKVLWSVALGEGYAAPAVRNGRVYILDYDQGAQCDALRCFSLASGAEIWRRSYPVVVKRNHGMSRTIPAVTDKYVVSLGPKCNVMCCDAVTGAVKWQIDLVRDYGTTVPEWYAGQCPLIDGNRAILAPGGKALMIALDLETGKVVWQTPNPRNWQMTHSSIMPMTFAGKPMYVYCGSGGVAGVSAKDGAILWDTTEWTINTATIPTPIPIGDGRVFLCGGYDSGAMMLRLVDEGGKIAARPLYRLASTVFGSDQQTPLLYQGHIYGVRPSGEMVCLGLDGKIVWTSGNTQTFGLGAYTIADGLLFAIGDNGKLTMAEASPAGWKPLAQAKVLDGPDCWGPMAVVGGRLLARDLNHMVCLDVAAH